MKLKNKLYTIASSLSAKMSDKSIYSLNKFISKLHIQEDKAYDFSTLVDNINLNYIAKSVSYEKFFIENIAHTYNTKTNENLFDFSNINLAKNYKEKIQEFQLQDIANKLDNKNYSEKDIIHSINNLSTYNHKQNSDFMEQIDAKYSYKKLAKVKYIDYKNIDKNPIMLTFTVDSNFRKYKKINPNIDGELGSFDNLKEIEKNKEANLQELIEESYNNLNSTFRNFYQHTKTLNMRQGVKDKLDYILIFEAHKSMTLHLHVLIYCNTEQLANLRRSWSKYLLGLDKNQRKGQDYKAINRDIATGATYVSKYLVKEYNSTEDQEDKNFFLQYKRYFSKFKLFRTSNFYHTTQKKIDKMYSYFAKNYPDLLKNMKLSDIPIYIIFEELDIKAIFQFEQKEQNFLSAARDEIKKFFNK